MKTNTIGMHLSAADQISIADGSYTSTGAEGAVTLPACSITTLEFQSTAS